MANGSDDSVGSSATAGDSEEFGECSPDDPVQQCPLEEKYLALVPRSSQNIFDSERWVRPLLPDRYPPGADEPVKSIEYVFFPDLNTSRTITAVVTSEAWQPGSGPRPNPKSGVTVYFSVSTSTTADVTLSSATGTTDVEGCASVTLTVNTLVDDPAGMAARDKIEILAGFEPATGPASLSVEFQVHRNQVGNDTPLAATESPDDYAATLAPVLELRTWVVEQGSDMLESETARAVQQLLNQVSARKASGGHVILSPDGEYGAGTRRELARFINDFSGAAGGGALPSFEACNFGVTVEEDDANARGVKTYARLEYGGYREGQIVDSHLLIGTQRWNRGSNVMDADGLLDIFEAVTWEFIESLKERADAYVNLGIRWIRHPEDDGCSLQPHPHPLPHQHWPDAVTTGMAYTFGGASSIVDFQNHLNANPVAPPAMNNWNQYVNGSKVGMHDDEYNAHPNQRHHYTGIDCSAFIQRCALEANFRAGHCADLAGQRIARTVPGIGNRVAANQPWPGRLATGSLPNHYNRIPNRAWKRRVIFWMDVLNVQGSHVVFLDTNNRQTIVNPANPARDIMVLEAAFRLIVPNPCPAQVECTRRARNVPLCYWNPVYTAFVNNQNNNNHEYGRIHIWS